MKYKKSLFIVVSIMLILLGTAFGVLVYRHYHSFKYSKSLDEILVTISDNNITLREMSYYVIKVENEGNEAALIYDSKNPTSYWACYMNDEFKRSGFVTELAKLSAMDCCIRDNIYYQEAMKTGYSLSDEEISDIRYSGEEEYNHMTKRQKDTCGLNPELVGDIKVKEETAHSYIRYLSGLYDEDEIIDNAKVIGNVSSLYDIGGEYYESLKESYNVQINQELWDKVRIGFVTIN
jgi:hypothetical protein